jgi:hypothetical protein
MNPPPHPTPPHANWNRSLERIPQGFQSSTHLVEGPVGSATARAVSSTHCMKNARACARWSVSADVAPSAPPATLCCASPCSRVLCSRYSCLKRPPLPLLLLLLLPSPAAACVCRCCCCWRAMAAPAGSGADDGLETMEEGTEADGAEMRLLLMPPPPLLLPDFLGAAAALPDKGRLPPPALA